MTSPTATATGGRGLATTLLRWFDAHRRSLPWRGTQDPYRIWVAEVMLQQTRVETVVPYYERWMRLFPDVQALAAAPRARVMKAWEGLGYYARARRLHEAAQIVAREGWPRGLDTLPGVGPYIAAALASQAFGRAEPVWEANAARILVRYLGRAIGRADGLRWLRSWIPRDRPGDFNQALMELGQTVCRPRAPRCPICPLRRRCAARHKGLQDRLPARRARRPVPHLRVAVAIVQDAGRVLIARRRDEGLLGGLWEFPGGKMRPGERAAAAAAREVFEETGVEIADPLPLVRVRHRYSHFAVTIEAFTARRRRGRARPRGCAEVRWVHAATLDRLAFPAANRRILEAYRQRLRDARRQSSI